MELETPLKKRKIISSVKFIVKIVELHIRERKWLVEWSDKTRTWETYEVIKDLHIFQDFLFSKIKPKEMPSYIS